MSPARQALLVHPALMEPKVLQVLPELRDRMALLVWRELMERQELRVLLVQRALMA